MGPPLPLTLPLGNLFLSPDGSSLAAVDGKFVSLWTVTNASRSWNLDSGTNGILRIEWCPGGGEIAVLSSNLARFCHPVTGTNLFAPLELSDPKNDFSDLRFSPDGRGFVICEKEPNFAECSATLRNAATGVKVGEPMGHSDGVIRGVFSPNRRWICTGGEDFKLYIWSAVDATHVSGPMSHGQQVMGIDFSSDSEWIASASADMTTRVWRRDRGEPLTPPLRLRFPQTDVRFIAGDKKLVVTTGKAPNIQTWIWELPTEKRTAEEIEVLAHFLNGTIYHPPAESGSASAKSLEEVFLRLKAQDPKLFATTTEDLLAWHQTEADIAYDANRDGFSQEFAYYFHTNRLAQLKAGMANAAAAHLSGNGSNQSR
jgi:WD40 repeat protein